MNLKRILLILILVLYCQDVRGKDSTIDITKPLKQLNTGERLVYSLQWLGVPVGNIILEVKEITVIDNRPCYHIVAKAMPNRFFRKIHDVEYVVHTYVDTEKFYPYRFQKQKRYKKEISDIVIDFDRYRRQAHYKNVITKEHITIRALSFAQDLLSSLYYFRLRDIKKGDSTEMDIVYGNQVWKVKANVGETQTMDIRKKGSFDVFVVNLNAELSRIILGRRDIEVFFTNDSVRIPLRFTLYTAFGPIQGLIKNPPLSK